MSEERSFETGLQDGAELGRILSSVERDGSESSALRERIAKALGTRERRARRVVVTGPPGVGKSTLLRGVLATLRARGDRVAVLACDPSSPKTGGAFLGDRVRWSSFAEDDGVFIRSVAQRGEFSEMCARVDRMADTLDAAGWDWVLLETVGVGQNEEAGLGDARKLLVLSPACGDEMQMLKAGVIEAADVCAVNRLDLPGADRWVTMLEETLALGEGDVAPVVRVDAANGGGVDELLEALEGASA